MFVQESMLKPGSGQHNAGAYAWILWDLSLTGGRTGPQTRLGSPEVERDRRQPDSKLWPVTSWARLQSGQISYRRHFPLCFKKNHTVWSLQCQQTVELITDVTNEKWYQWMTRVMDKVVFTVLIKTGRRKHKVTQKRQHCTSSSLQFHRDVSSKWKWQQIQYTVYLNATLSQ